MARSWTFVSPGIAVQFECSSDARPRICNDATWTKMRSSVAHRVEHCTTASVRTLKALSDMNKPTKILVTLALLAGFGSAVWFSLRSQHQEQIARQEAVEQAAVAPLSGIIALDVEAFFKDPRVTKLLAANKLPVRVTRVGSRDMAARLAPGLSGKLRQRQFRRLHLARHRNDADGVDLPEPAREPRAGQEGCWRRHGTDLPAADHHQQGRLRRHQ